MQKTTIHLKKITMTLAREPGHPEGSFLHRYEFVAPLDSEGYIDSSAWHDHKLACVVHRYREGEPAARGLLVHRAGGQGGSTWGFDYNPGTELDDETGFRFGNHAFKLGEYVSIRNSEEVMETFKISALSSL